MPYRCRFETLHVSLMLEKRFALAMDLQPKGVRTETVMTAYLDMLLFCQYYDMTLETSGVDVQDTDRR
jgi:hypothetical protein